LPKGKQHGDIDPILRIHKWRYPRNRHLAFDNENKYRLLSTFCHVVYATKGKTFSMKPASNIRPLMQITPMGAANGVLRS
jgi:hypothetical protein